MYQYKAGSNIYTMSLPIPALFYENSTRRRSVHHQHRRRRAILDLSLSLSLIVSYDRLGIIS